MFTRKEDILTEILPTKDAGNIRERIAVSPLFTVHSGHSQVVLLQVRPPLNLLVILTVLRLTCHIPSGGVDLILRVEIIRPTLYSCVFYITGYCGRRLSRRLFLSPLFVLILPLT